MKRIDRVVKRIILAVICVLAFITVVVTPAVAQKDAAAAATAVQDAAKKGFPLTSSSTDVTGNISVEAALIPAKIASTVFGREVAHNYVIIALTISNRSADDSFIVHTIFVDYSQWLLSGSSKQSNFVLCLEGAASGAQAKSETGASGQTSGGVSSTRDKNQKADNAKQAPCCAEKTSTDCTGNLLRPWQQQTFPNQISTVETRIVRGELLDKQPWTTRNWVLRALQGVGSIAAGFTFATTNQDWIRSIGAYNAHFIPGIQGFWPDATVGQMNRISDLGFQVNKVIGKQNSDVVVAFFPIERFLTPGLRKIFLDSPAVFFSPFGMLLDPKRPPLVNKILAPIFSQGPNGTTQDAAGGRKLFLGLLPKIAAGACDCLQSGCKDGKDPDKAEAQAADPNLVWACQVANLLDLTSLNTVRVIVGGTMTVDVNKVPAQITEVDIDQDKDGTATWKKGSSLTGVIRGSFLGGGTPTITKPENLQAAAVTKDSSDTELYITITPKEDLPVGTNTLTFQVSKKSDGSTITSTAHDYTVVTAPKTGSGSGAAPAEAKPQAIAPTETTKAPATPATPQPKK